MKNKIGKILCFSSLLMIGGNKVLSMEEPKEEGGKGGEEVPKGDEGKPKEDEGGKPKEEGGKGGEEVPPQQPQQGGGNGEDFEALKKDVDEIEKNTHPESEKITLTQFCSGQK